ncbi:hypothetical protein WL82_23965 [Burkholderia ubonensis]|uniref:hypothetical protein n=1 Tax=Burkholderia ubonensis TaxID=101571 RepID=UPI0007573881|nr:hypothetical protein [Burkholderia ubonensis]KWE97366.1 hypothetical protein WL82_23965 [Burkholderia ubonensis]
MTSITMEHVNDYVVDRVVIPLASRERFAGPVLKEDGTLDYYLIVLWEAINFYHDAAKEYAASRGFRIPNRREGRVLLAAFPEIFENVSYWLEEPRERDPASAWCQHAYDRGQVSVPKNTNILAVLVRRFEI